MTSSIPLEIDLELCTGCGDCIVICRPGALALTAGKAALAYPDRCRYCADCEPVCPVGAVSVPYAVVFSPALPVRRSTR